MTMDDHIDCDRQLNEAEDKILELTKRITELETALQGIVPFIEEDFPKGTDKNHGTCATDEYQEACNAVIEALKGE